MAFQRPPLLLCVLLTLSALSLCACPGFGDEERVGTLTEVPDQPTFEQHIGPIMSAYCTKCHTPSTNSLSGFTNFRLDVCTTTDGVAGTKEFASRVLARSVNSSSNPMPPSSEPAQLSNIEKQTIERWVEVGTPCSPDEIGEQDAGNDADTGEGSFYTDQVVPVLQANTCLDSGCHSPAGDFVSAGYDMTTEEGARLGVVEPCNPEGSILIQKLRENTVPYGDLMPIGADPMPEADIAIVEQWVRDGAGVENACNTGEDVGPVDAGDTGEDVIDDTGSPDTDLDTSNDVAPDTPEELHPSFEDILAILGEPNNNCTSGGCHGGTPGTGGLNLTSIAEILEGGNNGPAVVPCDPDNSSLFTKLRDETRTFGSTMPLGPNSVSDEHVAAIRAWIADGAQATYDPSICGDTEPPLFEGANTVEEAIDGTSCRIAWNPGFDNVTPPEALRYVIYGGLSGEINMETPVATTAPGVTEYTFTGLTEGVAYQADIRALDQAGNESTDPRIVDCTPTQP